MAVTRAEELLFITHAKIRTIYGNTNYTLPSRFIKRNTRRAIPTIKIDRRENRRTVRA